MQIKTLVLLLFTMRAMSQPIINGRRPPTRAKRVDLTQAWHGSSVSGIHGTTMNAQR